jgi:hypothetical protein
MKKSRRTVVIGAMVMCLTLIAGTALAAGNSGKLSVKPGTFVGTASECAPFPAGTKGGVTANWAAQQGLPDAGNSNHALILAKNVPTTDCSAAGADVLGVAGMPADVLGFDYRTADSYCGAGAPRFNVQASDGFHFVGGCANGSPTPAGTDSQGRSWSRVTFDLHSANAIPPVALGATFVSVTLIQDEQGTAILDNINVDGSFVGKPGNN